MIKRFLAALFLLASPALATTTSRLGLSLIDDGTEPWGDGVRDNYTLIDSSVAALTKSNTFTDYNTFTSSISVSTMTTTQVRISTDVYSGTEKLAVNGAVKIFSPTGGTLSLCDQNGINCASVSMSNSNPSTGVNVTTMTTAGLLTSTTIQASSITVRNLTATNAIVKTQLTFPNFSATNGVVYSASNIASASPDVAIHDTPNNAILSITDTSNPFSSGSGYAVKIAPTGHLGAPTSLFGVHVSFPDVGSGGTNYGFYANADRGIANANFGAFLSASGAVKSNYGLWVDAGQVIVKSSMTVNQGIAVSTLTVATSLTASTATITNLVGTTTNDNATNGTYGEYLSSATATNSFPSTGVWGDGGSVSLTAGDWDVTASYMTSRNGATVTTVELGISATSGNSTTGMTLGTNWSRATGPTVTSDVYSSVPSYRVSLSGTTPIYLKVNATYSIAIPTYVGRITARRVR